MGWRYRWQTAWQNLPVRLRRFLIVMAIFAVGLVVLAFVGPDDLQMVALLVLFGLFILVQIAVLWILAQQNAGFRQARRAFVKGEFDEVVEMLTPAQHDGTIDALSQTLLGNAYRQLGRLDESERALRAVHDAKPNAPFPAYGLGRTLMAQAKYDKASALIALALDRRGQPVIVVDLAHAQYRAGLFNEAAKSLARTEQIALEPHRALMTCYLLWQLENQPVDSELFAEMARFGHGLETWRLEAERFKDTPYGVALREDVVRIEKLLEGVKS